jgi:glycosyltransferase involved in cell wall biosynthesis
MTLSIPRLRDRPQETSAHRVGALVAGFEFEQAAFRGTSFFARSLLRALSELGIETLLLTSAATSGDALLERLAVARHLAEPSTPTTWARRTGFLRDLLWPARPRRVSFGQSSSYLDRVDYLRWVDACLNRPAVYDYIRMRSHHRWPAYTVPWSTANVVIAPAPIHIRAPRGVPLVMAFHDLSPVLRADHPPQDDSSEYLCRIRSMERHADAVLCSSEASRGELIAHFPSLTDRTTVIHPPVTLFAEELALAQEPEVERSVLGRYGVERGSYLLYVGVLERKKNVRRLVDAYIAVRQQIDIPLLLAGWMGYGAHEVEPALSRGANGARHLGYVSQTDKIVLMRNARALVFPSLYEGFGLPPLEAMQLGCPVLASNIPAVAEACADAAYLVDCRSLGQLAAGLIRISLDNDLRAELTVRGLRRAAQLSLANYRRQLGGFLSHFAMVPATRSASAAAAPGFPALLSGSRLAADATSANEQ